MRRARQFLRALWLRCPLCGTRWPREGWLRLAPQCPTCQLSLERHEGDFFLGAYTINLLLALFGAVGVVLVSVRFPGLPPVALYGGGAIGIIALALWLYPVSKLVWLAVDLQFRPAAERDFDETG
jgi:uncharacterized protein (DUF983 family)